MAREMTPQERADLKEIARKLVLQINEITPMQWDKHDDKDQAIVLAALQTTRRAALLEAAKLVGDYNCMHDHGKKATKACDDVFDELTRLAQEGA